MTWRDRLVRTIYRKLDSPGVISKHDLLPLYSVMKNFKVNVGVLAAFGIHRLAFDKNKGMFVGGFIT